MHLHMRIWELLCWLGLNYELRVKCVGNRIEFSEEHWLRAPVVVPFHLDSHFYYMIPCNTTDTSDLCNSHVLGAFPSAANSRNEFNEELYPCVRLLTKFHLLLHAHLHFHFPPAIFHFQQPWSAKWRLSTVRRPKLIKKLTGTRSMSIAMANVRVTNFDGPLILGTQCKNDYNFKINKM